MVEAVDVSLTTVSALMDSVAALVGLSLDFSAELSGVAEGTGPWSLNFASNLVSPADVVDVIFCLKTSLIFSSGFEAEPFAPG